jgi:rRNA maturation endonuclease Nob1
MYTLQPPFHEIPRDITVILRVLGGSRPYRPTQEQCHGRTLPNELWVLLEKCWSPIPADRPSLKDLETTIGMIELARMLITNSRESNPSQRYIEQLHDYLRHIGTADLLSLTDFAVLSSIAEATHLRIHLTELLPRLPRLVCETLQNPKTIRQIDDLVHPFRLATALVRSFKRQCGPAWEDMALAATEAMKLLLVNIENTSKDADNAEKVQAFLASCRRCASDFENTAVGAPTNICHAFRA